MPGGMTLASLLAANRSTTKSQLTEAMILNWADAYFDTHRSWPKRISGVIEGTNGDTWGSVEYALYAGTRGLGGGKTLAQLLLEHRGVRNQGRLRRLTVRQVLAWAEAYNRKTGAWPSHSSGYIEGTVGETWQTISAALASGRRGLPTYSSLAAFFRAEERERS